MDCSRSFGIGSGEVTVILCSDANGLAAGFGASLDTAEIARLPESLEEARLALGLTSPAQPLGHFADIDAPQFLIWRADSITLRLIPAGVRYLTPAGGASEYKLMLSLQASGNIIPKVQSNLTIVTSLVFNYLTSGRNEPSIRLIPVFCVYTRKVKSK